MIKVLITKEENSIKSIEIKGHANSAEYGHDIICSAVSAVITGGCNAINDKKSFELVLDEGHALIKARSEVSSHDEVVLETIETQLKTIEEVSDKFVKIKNL